MTLHAFKESVVYWWTAKDLHGVHSPFAYEFSEKILRDKVKTNPPAALKEFRWLPAKYFRLLDKLMTYYHYKTIHSLTHDNEDEPAPFDVLVLKEDAPGNWVRLFNKYYPHMLPNCTIVVSGIHKTERHSAKWTRLHKHPKVQMSIDLYGIGILFFRKEFKEKQHFVLKY